MIAERLGRAGRLVALVVPLAFAMGCGNGQAPAKLERGAAVAPTSGSAMAADLCSEHGVLRVVCTKCNPKLAVIFRANGDFCEEHGLPLSLCPIHHPERGGRPLVD
ncbi:MAG: efflux RND transporter periplasmic adaptor subunit, partial [Candidatus Eisenbacteria bacterium]